MKEERESAFRASVELYSLSFKSRPVSSLFHPSSFETEAEAETEADYQQLPSLQVIVKINAVGKVYLMLLLTFSSQPSWLSNSQGFA